MFRDNEATRVGAVLERKHAGDRAGMVTAALELFVAPRERPAEPDRAVAEVWAALIEAGVRDHAIEATLEIVARHQRIRGAVFVAIVHALENPVRLLELARFVVDARWEAHPFLVVVLLRLVEMREEPAVWQFVQTHHRRLGADVAAWTAVGFVLTTTWVGNRDDLDAWFAGWEMRAGTPMWILAAYLTSITRLPVDRTHHLIALARAAFARATWDSTASYFAPYLAFGDLVDGRLEDFTQRAHSSAIAGAPHPRDNPIVSYANGLARGAVLGNAYALADDLGRVHARNDRVVSLFAEMIEISRGDPRIGTLYRAMRSSGLRDLPMLQPIWRRVVRERVRWHTRLRLEYF